MRPWILVLAVAGTLAVALGQWPLGIPGEWVWERFPAPVSIASVGVLSLAACAFLLLAGTGARRMSGASRSERAGWLLGLTLATFGWLWIVQEECPSPLHQLSKAGWVLYYPGPSGYFTEARRSADDRAEYLRSYSELLAEGDVLHLGTHPPGLVVIYWGLMDAVRGLPAVAAAIESLQPESVKSAFGEIERWSARGARRLTRSDRQVLWLALLLVQLAASVAVVPLYLLARADHGPEASWGTACLWAGVPAVAVFIPKSDVVIAFLGLCALALWVPALRAGRTWVGCLLAVLTGLAFWVGLCISLAVLPIGFAAALVALWEVLSTTQGERRRKLADVAVTAVITGGTMILLVAIVWITTGLNLLDAWRWNYQNHAAFYSQFPRTWWKWLLLNPVELAVAAGLPVSVTAIASLRRRAREWNDRRNGLAFAFIATWLILWVSGKNSGEAARLWVFVMPWVCWLAADSLAVALAGTHRKKRLALVLAGCQLACSAILTTHVGGFFSGGVNFAGPAEPVAAWRENVVQPVAVTTISRNPDR